MSDTANPSAAIQAYAARFKTPPRRLHPLPKHLAALEAESIHIMREVAAEFKNPALLYSIGKDSTVMLHLALKAFWPSKPPFP
ncbi:MAG: phosphoadenosine phosphosulfate reductase family protein, partial [Pseudomonadota bacterium]